MKIYNYNKNIMISIDGYWASQWRLMLGSYERCKAWREKGYKIIIGAIGARR